jgi:tripartite-type tricarboxylate transporter receptor subunit TctC
MKHTAVSIVACLVALLTPAVPSAAQEAASFYEGKIVEMLVAAPSGTGIDLLARVLASHMTNYIPGKPRIIVRNMPGGGGVLMARHLQSAGRKDGTEFGAGEGGMILNPLLGINPGQLDMTKFGWIGSASQDTAIAVVWAASGVRSIEDAKTREVIIAATGAAGTSGQWGAIANATLGTRFRTVFGYPGTNDMNLAMERGEAHGRLATNASLRALNPEWFSERKINVILRMGPVTDPDLAGVPDFEALAKTDDDRAMIRLIAATFLLNRPYMAPPGVAPERLKVLRDAFDATVKDPAFIAAANNHTNVAPSSGPELERFISEVYATPQRVVAKLLALGRSQTEIERLQKEQRDRVR